MGTVAETWAFTPPQPGAAPCKAAWDGTQSLAVTVAATGAPVATFAGQSMAGLAAPLAQFASGDPAGGAAVLGTLGFPAIDPTGTDVTEDGTQAIGAGLLVPPSTHVHPFAGGMWLPADHTLLGMNADYSAGSGGVALVANTIYLQKIVIRKPTTITNLWYAITAAGVGASTGAGSLVALFNASGTRLGANSADVSGSLLATGWVPFALGSPQAVQPGTYYAAIVSNLVTTQPSMLRMTNTTAIANPNLAAAAFRWATNSTGAPPSSLTLASNAATALTLVVGWN